MIKMIWAEDVNHGIAKNNMIPWNIKQDMLFFQKETKNNIVVMGRKTWDTLKYKPLKNRINYILTNDKDFRLNILNTYVINDANEILELNLNQDKDIYIIGGKEIYDLFFNYADQLIISKINKNYDCDKFLNYNLKNYTLFQIIEFNEFKVFIYNKLYE